MMRDNFEKLGGDVAGIVAGLKPTRAVPSFGLHDDIEAARYHADDFFAEPTLSSSIANILYDETPRHARQAHPRLGGTGGKKASREMDLGSVAHEIMLGKGGGFSISPYETYQSNKAKEWRDETIAEGLIPIKEKDANSATQMAASLRVTLDGIPGAEAAFMRGRAETVVLWRDIGGPLCRAMLDWLDEPIIYDLKTTARGLSDRSLRTRIAEGLDLKGAFHMRGLETAAPQLAGRVKWRWVFLEAEDPFEARVVEMDGATREYGDRKAALAIAKWRRCLAENHWPGYPRVIERPEYAAWAESNVLAREMEDPDAMHMRTMHQPMSDAPSKQLLGPH